MPLALKLSEEFYGRLGDRVANEFVDALNVIDASYRQEFRELFDANFGRLEARMEALESRMDAKLEALKAELLRWMFLFWVGTMGTVLAMLKL
jgi:hypothetical protein